ncbi:MAG: serine/threonine-protein phosphatase [Ruminococcus sp.]|nr:serine/threonine-protein phosphatase [Ruminococcus sp.]MBP8592908.1 serine/threonine-protein phosphatase [Ruminococcus sp.]MBQ8122700.1 serine/threonine-protein phosphatase [Ruminococcus sp.]HBB19918.1 serine/threonine-protein phosphatase [Ruminococcus sp.]
MYYCCGITEKGVMPHNEDAMLIGRAVIDKGSSEQRLSGPFIAAVSDGVSGEAAGEVASKMCLEQVRTIEDFQRNKLKTGLLEIHHRLAEYSQKHKDSTNMQTTLCGIAVSEEGEVVSFNVGDSRLYRYRGGRIRQISRDQSLVQLLYEEGSITQEERRTHVHRNIIFPAFGNVKTDPKIDVEIISGGMEYGDILLLCSDGLSDYVSSIDMQEVLEMPKSLPKRLSLLVKRALDHGGQDNITVIAVIYQGEDPEE